MATPITLLPTPEVISTEVAQPHRATKWRDPRISSLPLPVLPSKRWRKANLLFTLLAVATPQAPAQLSEPTTVRVAVLTLFHPQTLILSAPHPTTLYLDAAPLLLPANQPLTLRSTPTGQIAELPNAPSLQTQILTLPTTTFTLTVPGKLTRTYVGALTLTTRNTILLPILTIDTELAVASILAAEAPPHPLPEALKAQAIASRSYLLSHPSAHPGFDACDTTHCQFLRSPPPAASPYTAATRATRNLVLTWRPSPAEPARIIPAMYSRSCGGRTRPHPTTPDAYPFYAVPCAFCQRHPETWTRPAPGAPVNTEQQRIAFNRTHGWSAIPSNAHTVSSATIEGRGTGHGIGLCQLGAEDLARRGATYAEILTRYYPNSSITSVP